MALNVVSIHQACAWLTATPRQFRAAANALGIEPNCEVNGIECFLEADVERIAAQLMESRGFGFAAPFNVPSITM